MGGRDSRETEKTRRKHTVKLIYKTTEDTGASRDTEHAERGRKEKRITTDEQDNQFFRSEENE